MKDNENNTTTEETLLAETPPAPVEEDRESITDLLADKLLEATVDKLIEEKLTLAQSATDNEEDEEPDEDDNKSIGMFPKLIIGGVAVFGLVSLFLYNRPISHPNESQTENDGYSHE